MQLLVPNRPDYWNFIIGVKLNDEMCLKMRTRGKMVIKGVSRGTRKCSLATTNTWQEKIDLTIQSSVITAHRDLAQ